MKKSLFIALIIFVLFFKAYSKETSTKKGSIYDFAFEGIEKSYKDYKKNPKYYVNGPFNTDGLAKEKGWKNKYSVGPEGDFWSIIIYLEKGKNILIRSVDIAEKIEDWYLAKYIGESKTKILEDFPLADKDTDKDFVIFYDSDERFIISVTVKDEIITHINISARL